MLKIRIQITAAFFALFMADIPASGQALSSGQWSKFSVTADAVYKIDYSLLRKAGFNPDQIDPRTIRIFSNGNGMLPQANAASRQNQLRETAIYIEGESDGKFDKNDYILFFGLGPDEYHFDASLNAFSFTKNIYSDKNFYFLTAGADAGKRMPVAENKPGSYPVINTFNDFGIYDPELYNIIKSGRSWYGDQFNTSTSLNFQFNIPGIAANSSISIYSKVMGQSYDEASSFVLYFNDVQVLQHTMAAILDSQYATKGTEDTDSAVVNSDQVNATGQSLQTIKYQYNRASSGYSVGYLDKIIISLERKSAWYAAQTIITSGESLSQPVSTFTIDGLPKDGVIWDITNPFNLKRQSFSFSDVQSSFATTTDSLKRFVYFIPGNAAVPVFEAGVPNQNLSALSSPDLLIITHPDFKSQASRLAAFRQSNNNLSVTVITPQEIYNSYSGGKQDITALRDFIRDLSSRQGSGLDNVLLFGRCSYDYKDRVPDNTNFVPTYESINSLSPLDTYSSDDYFGFLENSEGEWKEGYPSANYTMDIGVGRIPVVTLTQATDVVDKLIEYESGPKRFGPWRNKIVFVADDGDANLHQMSSDDLADLVETKHPELIAEKIYVDQFRQITKPSGQYSPDAKEALERAVDNGAFLVNFTGHGSEHLWMQEQVLDDALVEGWKNTNMYPLFVTATCEFGRHDDPFQLCNAERLLFQPGGGGISLITTARPVYSSTNDYLNTAFYQQLFVKTSGSYRDLGTIFRYTKNNSLSGVSNRNFSLLGDPSMHLALPPNDIVINTLKTANGSDTIKALSTVTIKGEIRSGGSLASGFNGDVAITIFDKPVDYLTRGDENAPFAYSQWSNAVFRGTVSASSGSFSGEFMVPQNIEAIVGSGKVSAYASSSSTDASGYSSLKIGGVEPDVVPDNTGPEIALFIGDTTFVNGGLASPNTTLVVQLKDPAGISISSYGGSNNLIALLDDSLTYNINAYYTTAKDSYMRGEALFPLKSLTKGRHTVTVTAFDSFGNPSSGTITFVITERNLVIASFYNYPNPFSTANYTRLGFTHNRPGEDLEVELTIVDLAGRPVYIASYSVTESYTDVSLADWDGTTSSGNKLVSGVYLGKLSVRSLLDGSKNQLFTKLIIVN